MSFNGWAQIIVFFALILAVTVPLGAYLFRVFESSGEGSRQPLPDVYKRQQPCCRARRYCRRAG